MATTKVSALTAKTTPAGTEELLINDSGVSKKITIDNVTENNFTDVLKIKVDTIPVSVKDFGATGDGVTDDTAAIQAAVDSNRAVYVPYGDYLISSAIVLSKGYSALIGDARMPMFKITAANGAAIRITAIGSTLNEFTQIENLKLWCIDKPTFSATPSATNCGLAIDGSTATVAAAVQRAKASNMRIIGFSVGVFTNSTVNTFLDRIVVEHHTDWIAETGYTSANKYVPFYLGGTAYTAGGISPNASIRINGCLANGNGAPANVTTSSYKVEGDDPRDIFFDDCECVGGTYGWQLSATLAEARNIDVHIRNPIIDAVNTGGIFVENYDGAAALTITGGYIVKSANTSGAAIWVNNSSGVSIGGGMQILGLSLNDTQDDGIRINGSNSCSVTGITVLNCNYGISIDGSSFCTVDGNIITASTDSAFEATPTLSQGIRVFSTSNYNTISSNVVKGASAAYLYNNGIFIEAGSTNNSVIGNSVDPTTVGTEYNILDTTNLITKMLAGVSTTDGRVLSTDGSKLDNIEASADVTDTANVTAAGALMDSEVTNLADVKAFDTTDYATSAQGTTADNALPKAGGTMTGTIAGFTSTGIDDNATSTTITIDTGQNVVIEGNLTQGNAGSASSAYFNSTANWNYGHLQVARNASNSNNFKAISFMLDGDTDNNTDLYGYPNIIINTDTAPTTGDTSVLENASMTINAPSTIRFGTSSAERMRITDAGITVTGKINADAMPIGSVIQTVHTMVTTNYQATSSTNIDFTPWNFNFTPKYSDSKVLVIVNAGIQLVCDGNIYLKRDGTIIKDSWFGASRNDNQYDYPQATGFYLDSPATTSSVNYKVGGRASGCGNVIGFGGSDNHASITFMEIAQ